MSSRRTRSLQPIALTAPRAEPALASPRASRRALRWRLTLKTPRSASSARSGSSSWVARISEALDASWANDARSALVVPARRLDDAEAEEGRSPASSSGRPRARRGAHSRARSADQRQDDRRRDQQPGEVADPPGSPGRRARSPAGRRRRAPSAHGRDAGADDAAGRAAARKTATSRGRVSVSGWRTKRRTSAAPTPACSAAARASASGTATASGRRAAARGDRAARLTASAPSATPPSIAPAEDQHARQRDAGRRIERRGAAPAGSRSAASPPRPAAK